MNHDPRTCKLGETYDDKPRVCHACSALWAAAPDLIEALERAIDIIEGEWPGLFAEGRVAIKKSEWEALPDTGPKQSWGDVPDKESL